MEKIKTKTVISDTIDNWLISTKGRDKNAQIYQLTQLMQPYLAMIFVNTKTRADELHSYLTAQGLKVAKIHGDIAPRERKRIMNQVKNLDFEYIVATDLAARGIDIEGVSHVINDAIPQDLSFFVHRVGRTGRKGLPGTAITLYQPSDDSDIRELEKLGIKFTPKMVKDGEFQDTYDRDRRANREKKQDKLDIEMIGLVKKKKKKVKPGYKKKLNGRLMKNAARPSALKIVLAVVQSVKQNAKHFNRKSWSTELQFFLFMRTNYLNRNTTLKTANCAKKWYNDRVI